MEQLGAIMGFDELLRHRELMRDVSIPWCFGGGWACDGWLGKASRPHADVDIVIWRHDQQAFHSAFADWQWHTYVSGEPRSWAPGTWLDLPFHNARGSRANQQLEVLMIEREEGDWWYRRNSLIRMPAERAMLLSPLGLMVLNPAIALLFKSTRLDDKDWHDFQVVLPVLPAEDRQWLKQALLVADPQHPWNTRL